jgi:hypothetical protein
LVQTFAVTGFSPAAAADAASATATTTIFFLA